MPSEPTKLEKCTAPPAATSPTMLPQASWPRPPSAPSSSAAASATPAIANGSSNSAACSNKSRKSPFCCHPERSEGSAFCETFESRIALARGGCSNFRDNQALGQFAHLQPRDLLARFRVDDRAVVAARVAHAAVGAIGRKRQPVWCLAGGEFLGKRLCGDVIDIHAVGDKTRHPQFLAVGGELKAMRRRVRYKRLQAGGPRRGPPPCDDFLQRNIHHDETVQGAQHPLHPIL